jgi:RecB family exonuclease
MLIEGYDRDTPMSPAEVRVQAALKITQARSASDGTVPSLALRACVPDLAANLADAAELARQRFLAAEHGPYDGLLRDPAVVAEVCKAFGPERILSPTALENYIACPFKFFLKNVLRLEVLEEPSEEIESTDRGLAFHRALSRLHTHLRGEGTHEPLECVDAYLHLRLEEAVNECAGRAGPAAEVLWQIEGKRLQRMARRYRPHWEKFVAPWVPRGVRPRPEKFEVGFGLPGCDGEAHPPLVIVGDEFEVRVSGRIDRVDIAELPDGGVGFWIIDYKTGRAANYTGADLKEFRRLQLTLYALAVEEVLLADKRARPLGLAYWLVTDSGPKVALPGHPKKPVAWLDEAEAWRRVREELRRWVVTLVGKIRGGEFPLKPELPTCTQTCDFAEVCRISQSRSFVEKKAWRLSLPVIA